MVVVFSSHGRGGWEQVQEPGWRGRMAQPRLNHGPKTRSRSDSNRNMPEVTPAVAANLHRAASPDWYSVLDLNQRSLGVDQALSPTELTEHVCSCKDGWNVFDGARPVNHSGWASCQMPLPIWPRR